jgi:methionyl-tRNA formyltransferase
MKVYVYGDRKLPAVAGAIEVLLQSGVELAEQPDEADVAIAPLLQEQLSSDQLFAPKLGTLVFHPSLLPRHRGADAIKWAFRSGEPYSGATWFWADENFDTGDICESEVLAIPDGIRPRDYYSDKVLPSCFKMLRWIIDDLKEGHARRRPQDHSNATYEPPAS